MIFFIVSVLFHRVIRGGAGSAPISVVYTLLASRDPSVFDQGTPHFQHGHFRVLSTHNSCVNPIFSVFLMRCIYGNISKCLAMLSLIKRIWNHRRVQRRKFSLCVM